MMKTKFFVIFAAFLFAAIIAYNLQLAQTQILGDISLADITVMAQADGESGGVTCHQYAEFGRCNQCWKNTIFYCEWSGYMADQCCI